MSLIEKILRARELEFAHRFLDWKIPADDESFAALGKEPTTIEFIRDELRKDVERLEIEAARGLLLRKTGGIEVLTHFEKKTNKMYNNNNLQR
ncbi:MAG: hypothetical protein V7606_1121 [Burkholderiales bacterium]